MPGTTKKFVLLLALAVIIASTNALEARKVLHIPEKIIGGVIDIVQNHNKNKPTQVNYQQSQQVQQVYQQGSPQQYAPYQPWNANSAFQSSTQTQNQGQYIYPVNGNYGTSQFASGQQFNQYPAYQGSQFQVQNQNFDQSGQFQGQAGYQGQGQYQVQNQQNTNQHSNVNYQGSNQNFQGSTTQGNFQQNQAGFVGNQQTNFASNHQNQGSNTQGNLQNQHGFVGNQQSGFGSNQQTSLGTNQQASFGSNQQASFGTNQQSNPGQTNFGTTYPQGTQTGFGSQTSSFQGSGQGTNGFQVSTGHVTGPGPACVCQAWTKPPEHRSEVLITTTEKDEAKKTE